MVTVCRVEAEGNDVEAYRELRAKLWPMSAEENRRETSQQFATPEKWAAFLASDNHGKARSGSWKYGFENMQRAHLRHPSVFWRAGMSWRK